MNANLTESEFNILMEQRYMFECIQHRIEPPNPDGSWFLKFQNVYSRVFNAAKPNGGCGNCRMTAFQRIIPLIEQYKALQSQVKELPINPIPKENEPITPPSNQPKANTSNKAGTNKSRGRVAKKWN